MSQEFFMDYLIKKELVQHEDVVEAMIEQSHIQKSDFEILYEKQLVPAKELIEAYKEATQKDEGIIDVLQRKNKYDEFTQQNYQVAKEDSFFSLSNFLVSKGSIDLPTLIHAYDEFIGQAFKSDFEFDESMDLDSLDNEPKDEGFDWIKEIDDKFEKDIKISLFMMKDSVANQNVTTAKKFILLLDKRLATLIELLKSNEVFDSFDALDRLQLLIDECKNQEEFSLAMLDELVAIFNTCFTTVLKLVGLFKIYSSVDKIKEEMQVELEELENRAYQTVILVSDQLL